MESLCFSLSVSPADVYWSDTAQISESPVVACSLRISPHEIHIVHFVTLPGVPLMTLSVCVCLCVCPCVFIYAQVPTRWLEDIFRCHLQGGHHLFWDRVSRQHSDYLLCEITGILLHFPSHGEAHKLKHNAWHVYVGSEDQTQFLILSRQALYQWSHLSLMTAFTMTKVPT